MDKQASVSKIFFKFLKEIKNLKNILLTDATTNKKKDFNMYI